ncbi:extracellular solute-binding protein [Microbacterium murale]|uniref:Multiple sugar transport system substrate-binding protein n=1 Tax=Microbacterium murale TaxID=1081040 RepID=A0ABU0P5J1_9MICO|nr:extracellular solute-binding protein [Microbacterium murale]MDQ0642593.1 multiple sugar transport system substrate-binding protein [Microbacterium murale]
MKKSLTGLSILVVSGLAIAVSGCSGGTSSGGDDTLRIAYQKTSSFTAMDDLMKTVKAEYEKEYPDRKVELVPIEAEQDQYFTKLALMNGSADTAPDVIYEDTFQIRSDAAAGYLLPIDDYLADWDDWELYDDGAKQAGVGDDGKTYGVSLGTDTRGIYFNKDLFESAGLPTDWKPTSWEDILEAARAIKESNPDVTPLNIYASKTLGEATSMQGFEMLMYGTGDELMDSSSNKWVTESAGFLDALGFYETAFEEGLAPDPADALDPGWGSKVQNELIPQGKLAIAIDGSWLPSSWIAGDNAWPEWEETMGLAAMPTQDGGGDGFTSMSGGWTLAVGANADDPEAAFDFIAQAMTPENALTYHQEAGQIAVRSDVAASQEYLDYNPSFEFFSSLVAYTHFRPATPDYSQISSNIPVATESVITGQSSPKDAQRAYDEALVGIVGEENTQAG